MTEVKVIHLNNPFGLEFCTVYLIFEKPLCAFAPALLLHKISVVLSFVVNFCLRSDGEQRSQWEPKELLKKGAPTATSSLVFL